MQKSKNLADEILEVAQRQFHDYGYDATTFQRIADEIGITKGSITYHFKNKHLIVDGLLADYFALLRDYIEQTDSEGHNVYWSRCVMYIFAHRTFLGSRHNRSLFYHKTQMQLWETSKLDSLTAIYRDIAEDFHKDLSPRDIQFSAFLDFGARHRLYQEFCRPESDMTINDFCYYAVRLIGQLCNLDEATIQHNIRSAFAFADSHTPPIPPLLTEPVELPTATFHEFVEQE